MATPPLNSWTPGSEKEKDAVREQLDRILAHHVFRSSSRSSRFLRFVVEHKLQNDNDAEPLKERTLGSELFGRDPDYDTNQYTVVRNAASDLRKRIAQYYREPGHESEIRIEIATGSYLPSFHFPNQMQPGSETLPEVGAAPRGERGVALVERGPSVPSAPTRQPWQHHRSLLLLFVVLVIAASASVLAWRHWSSRGNRLVDMSELNLFWRPVLDAQAPEPVMLLCVEQSPLRTDGGQDLMPVGDALALADFSRFLGFKEKMFRISLASSVTIDDLEPATVLLIGGVGNPWTSYVTDGLRFHFSPQAAADSKEPVWIEDRKNPSGREWSLSSPPPTSGVVQDFAIVARFMDPKTGRWRVVVGGLGGIGTSVAAKLLIDAEYTTELTRRLPPGWTSRNIEAVIAVKVVNGKADYPQMVAYEVW